jgi:prepilin-type N-terminal cleavage/methylation domain-containing protein
MIELMRLEPQRYGMISPAKPPQAGHGARTIRPAPSLHTSRFTFHVSRFTFHASRSAPAFTLIELILVMAILTISVSLTAPMLSHFFRGRTLDSEARRLLALTRNAQGRAVSEGIPMDLWIDAGKNLYGLEAEPSYESHDARGVECALDGALKIEALQQAAAPASATFSPNQQISTVSLPQVMLARIGLPTIRFLPDGSIAESSPRKVRLTSQEGSSLWLAQARDRLSYEIRSRDD